MNIIRRNSELIFAILGFVIILLYYFVCGIEEKLLLGLLGTVATLYFGLIKHRIENDKLFKELFQNFNSRYDDKLNDLLNEIRYNEEKKLNKEERNHIIDYLNLCAEEYLWRSRNRIPKTVWNSWKAGILENLEIKQVNEIYLKETETFNGKTSFYGLVEELRNKKLN